MLSEKFRTWAERFSDENFFLSKVYTSQTDKTTMCFLNFSGSSTDIDLKIVTIKTYRRLFLKRQKIRISDI